MYRLIKISIIACLLLSFKTSKAYFTQRLNDSSYCLKIDGKLDLSSLENQKTCLVELICEDKIVQSMVLKNKKRSFRLDLAKNKYYTIRLSQEGCVTRMINVDTKILKEEIGGAYTFYFETRLTSDKEAARMNKEYLQMPIAMIFFDEGKNRFIYDKEYTKKVKEQLLIRN